MRPSAKDCFTTAKMWDDIDYILALQLGSKIAENLRSRVWCWVVRAFELVDRKGFIVAQGEELRV